MSLSARANFVLTEFEYARLVGAEILKECLDALQDTAAGLVSTLGERHPLAINGTANYALGMLEVARRAHSAQRDGRTADILVAFERAASLLEKISTVSDAVLGPQHPTSVAIYSNLAFAKFDVAQRISSPLHWDEAKAASESAAGRSGKLAGTHHPATRLLQMQAAVCGRYGNAGVGRPGGFVAVVAPPDDVPASAATEYISSGSAWTNLANSPLTPPAASPGQSGVGG
jgi:hypothetical protein